MFYKIHSGLIYSSGVTLNYVKSVDSIFFLFTQHLIINLFTYQIKFHIKCCLVYLTYITFKYIYLPRNNFFCILFAKEFKHSNYKEFFFVTFDLQKSRF